MRDVNESAALLVERVVRLATAVVFLFFAARLLPPLELGILLLSQVVIAVMSSVAGLGLDIVLPRYLARGQQQSSIFASAMAARLIAGALAWILLLLFLVFVRPPEAGTLLALSPLLVLTSSSLYEQVLLARSRHVQLSKVRLVIGLLFFAIRCLTAWVSHEALWIGLVVMLEGMALLLATRALVLGRGDIDRSGPRRRTTILVIRRSLPLLLASMMILLTGYSDQMLMRLFLGPAALAEYALGVRLAEAWIALLSAYALAVTPSLVKDHQHRMGDANRSPVLRKALERGVYSSILFVAASIVIAPAAYELIIGTTFVNAGRIAQLFGLCLPFVAMRQISGRWFVAGSLNATLARRAFLGLVMQLLLGLILIPRYGAFGAAMASVVTAVFVGLFFDYFHPKSRDVFWVKVHLASARRFREFLLSLVRSNMQ